MTLDALALPIKILVVDDEPDLPLLMRQTFKRSAEAWTFVFASDGLEALEVLDQDPEVDLVLTDINMPRMDGLTLLERIGAMDRLLRVVIVSAYGDMKNIRAAMNLGAFDFVTKPINLEDLKTTVAKAVQAVQALKQAAQAEQQLAGVRKELEVARQVQALKTRFFANLSHEFRTPLTLILGPVQDALEGVYGAEGQLPAGHLVALNRHALRLKRLIDQLLDLTKLEAGRMTLRAGRHDVGVFLQDLVQSFAPAAERKAIKLGFSASPGESLALYFEPDKLEKVVANLLSNAIKFTPAGGTVRLSLRPAGHTHLDIIVRDNGPGIPVSDLPYLFDRFHRAEASQTRGLPGTGIGLALAKELVGLHGGEIRVESEEGFGATFSVCLPLGKAHLAPEDLADEEALAEGEALQGRMEEWAYVRGDDEEAEADSTPEAPPTPKATVLIVEDNADVRAYLKRHLATRYHVVEAEHGAEGLKQARATTPDLVVSDVMMPEMDGFALCHALKTDEALRTIPVILLTARASEDDTLEGLQTGADAYLTKPFNARELLLRVENLIEVRRLLRERFSGEVVFQATGVAVPSADAVLLEQVQAYIEAHMGEWGFEVAQVADAVSLSPRQFRRKIRGLTGLSPAGYVRTLRLQRAAHLLEHRVGGVSEVAYAVGFQDAKYFSRLFREVYGVLPSRYGREGGQTG